MRARTIAKLGPALAFLVATSLVPGSAALRAEEPQPYLWRDFAPGENVAPDSDPRNLVLLPEGTWFSAHTRESGLEAWVIPRGSEAPQLLADLCPGACDTYPYAFAVSDAFLLFSTGNPFADPGADQAPAAVWVTAGSRASTARLFDLPAGSYPQEFWQLYPGVAPPPPLTNGVALFLMTHGPGRTEVWRTDGTVAGTYSLASFAIDGWTGISLRGTGAERLLFVSYLPGGLTEIWRTDGTRSGTRRVESFPLDVRSVTAGVPYFVFGTTPGEALHGELWSVDGAGRATRLFVDHDDLRLLGDPIQVGTRAVFEVVREQVGMELWTTDGTANATAMRSAVGFTLLDARSTATVGDDLFFAETLGESSVVQRLRLSGSGPPETVAVTCSGDCWDFNAGFVLAVGNALLFPVKEPALGVELVTQDALTGERTLFDLCPGACDSDPGRIRDLGGLILFSAQSEEHGLQLYSFAPPSGVTRLTDLPFAFESIYDPDSIPLLLLPDRLYFAVSVRSSGKELCSAALDGSHSAVVADLGHEPWSSSANVAAVFADGMFITATQPGNSLATLYWSDGTPEGTEPVPQDDENGGCSLGYAASYLALSPLGEGSVYWTLSYPFNNGFDLCLADAHAMRRLASGLTGSLLAQGPELFWTASDEAWVFDARTSASHPLFTLPVELAAAELAFADDRWLYFLSAAENLSELWRISRAGAGLSRLKALPPESTAGFARRAQLGARTLFFLATPERIELWVTNGTAGGTGSIAAWPLAAGYLDTRAFAAYRDRLYFLLDSGAAGETELWSTDGTPAGTGIAARLPAGRFGYSPSARATPLGLYFIAGRGEDPAELWRSNGTQAGTFALYPPADGVAGQGAIDFTFFRDRILVSATDDEAGAELWQTFGTRGSTSRAADLRPGAAGSGPGGFAVLGDRLFFSADDGVSGLELWATDAPTAFPCPAASDLACTGDGRFRWLAGWRDFANRQGAGQVSAAIPGAAAFWFFAPENLELVGKTFDGSAVNGFSWTYLAALSNLETSLTLFDVATEAHADYTSPLGQFTSLGDVRSLPAAGEAVPEATRASWLRPPRRSSASALGICSPSSSRLCLVDGRFAVEVSWRDFAGRAGAGYARELTAETGSFWFFTAGNPELVVKVLDGIGTNGHFWVFAGALGNLELELTVSDTLTGDRRTYATTLGQFMSFGDLTSFPE